MPDEIHYPQTSAALGQILSSLNQSHKSFRVLGSCLSPSDIALSNSTLINLKHFDHILDIDKQAKKLTVQAGVQLREIHRSLAKNGLALPVSGSITGQTIAGATATAVHGTGLNNGSFSDLVSAINLVNVDGQRLSYDEAHDDFYGITCHLGSLGVIESLTLKLEDAFDLVVNEQPNSLDAVLNNLADDLNADYYRFWLLPHTDRVWQWKATKQIPQHCDKKMTWQDRIKSWYQEKWINYHCFEFLLFLSTYRPNSLPAVHRWMVKQRFSAPRHLQGNGVEMMTFDCLFKQHVNEWCIPIEKTEEAIKSLLALIEAKQFKVHLPIEVRFVKADKSWMSPNYGRDSCYIGIIAYTPYQRETDFRAYFDAFEQLMSRLGGRPHWAKRFNQPVEDLALSYPKWNNFQQLRKKLDPHYRLQNDFTRRTLDYHVPAMEKK